MKILLTGSTGLVGQSILDTADSSSFEFLTPSRQELNLFDISACDSYLRAYQPDLVIHCAGLVGGIQANINSQDLFLFENTIMGFNLIKSSLENGITRFLNLASSCIYPKNFDRAISESDLLSGYLEPTNEGYALAKISCLKLCEHITNKYDNLHYKTFIPCNLYGKFDKYYPTVSHLVPSIINKVIFAKREGIKEIEIWGDGTARREFMYAGDLAKIIFTALAMLHDLPNYINIGIGRDYSINEYYHIISGLLGWDGHFRHDITKPEGMKRKLLDTSLQIRYGLESTSTLQQGLVQTINFFILNN